MRRITLFIILTLFLTGNMHSQRIEIKEPGILEVYYIKHSEKDTINIGKNFRDGQMALRIGKDASMFYPVQRFWRDSLMETDFNKYMEIERKINPPGAQNWTPLGGLESEYIFKNIPKGKNTVKDRFDLEGWYYEEDADTPQWELLDSAKVVLGYECSLAKSNYRGRTWYAWYTMEIPVHDGPWKLGGLPGLIMQAYDSAHHYIFTANALRHNNISPVGIYMYGSRVSKLTRNDFLKKRYISNNTKHDYGSQTRATHGIESMADDEEEEEVIHVCYDFEETDYPHK